MLPTSARVAQEVYEPLIGIQYSVLCSRLGDTWQIGTTSIREDQLIASGLRFVQRRHASPNIDARKEPKNNPTVRVYQHLEDELTRAGAGNEGILALTTTREGAQNLRNYFEIAWKTANAETAVKVAGATAKQHCHTWGVHFPWREGRNLDDDQECFTRANVAHSRATNLTILACPLNMQGMPGALQVLAALLHGVQSIDTYGDRKPVMQGSPDLTPIQAEKATTLFHQALPPPSMVWPPACVPSRASPRFGKALAPRLSHTVAFDKGRNIQPAGWAIPPGGTTEHGLVYGCAVDAMPTPDWLVITDGQQPGHWRLLHNSTGRGQRCSDPGLLTQGCYWPQRSASDEVLSVLDIATEADAQACQTPTSPETADAVMTDEEAISVLSSSTEPSTLLSTVHQEEADSPMGDKDAEANPSDEANLP